VPCCVSSTRISISIEPFDPAKEVPVTDPDRPIEGLDELVSYFHEAETPREDWRVGTEHEKVGIYSDSRKRIPFDGESGIERLLDRIAEDDGWARVHEEGRLIALLKDRASITLEPGGQIELSGAPLRTTPETCKEFNTHVDLVNRLSSDLGIVWLGLGIDPIHDISSIPKMPKARYDIMRNYLPKKGPQAMQMMHATGTVQANFDYLDEADMVAKLRSAMACTPIVSAIFANSSISEGKENGFASKRVEIWRHTDPDRCGLLHFVLEPDFGYRAYAEWALDIPMFFIVRDGHYRPGNGMTFRQFMVSGSEGDRATAKDWDTHLTTLFPEVRLKRVIEVRGADAAPKDLICALPALWRGILYDDDACAATWELCRRFGGDDLDAGLADVARRGLGAELAGHRVLDLARELLAISEVGIERIVARGESDAREGSFLDPIRAQLELGMSPGEHLVQRWRNEWAGSMERLIESTKY
jgi:glutamate--cysteine ligase